MAEFDPDEFLRKYGDLSTEPAPYPYEAWDKFGSGVGRGFTNFATETAPYLPFGGQNFRAAEAVERAEADLEYHYHGQPYRGVPDPIGMAERYGQGGETQGPEAAGKFVGEIAPTLLMPETGLGALATQELLRGGMVAAPRTALVLGRTVETGAQGAISGATTPGRDKAENITTGAAAGGALGASQEVARIIPPKYKWLLSLVPGAVAVEILHRMGVITAWPSYPAAMGLGSSLGALAAGVVGKVPPATAGSIAAHIRGNDDGR